MGDEELETLIKELLEEGLLHEQDLQEMLKSEDKV